MSPSLKIYGLGGRVALTILSLIFLLSIQAYAAPVWGTPERIATSRNLGCIHGCNFVHPHPTHSNSTEFLITTGDGEPLNFPELSAGHFLVIPVAAVAAIGYHVLKMRAGKPL